jgi:hypothetical protein
VNSGKGNIFLYMFNTCRMQDRPFSRNQALNVGLALDCDVYKVIATKKSSAASRIVADMAVVRAVKASGHRVIPISVSNEGKFPVSIEKVLQSCDVVFNLARSATSAESKVPAALARHRVPYTGSDGPSIALANDKLRSLNLLRRNGLPAAETVELKDTVARRIPFSPPYFVKPKFGASSRGIYKNSVAFSAAEAQICCTRIHTRLGLPVICQPFFVGREISAGYLMRRGRWQLAGVSQWCFPEGDAGFKDETIRRSLYHRGHRGVKVITPSLTRAEVRLVKAIGIAALDLLGRVLIIRNDEIASVR